MSMVNVRGLSVVLVVTLAVAACTPDTPTATPNLQATVDAAVQAALAQQPIPTASPTASPTPTRTPSPTPSPTPLPTSTPTPEPLTGELAVEAVHAHLADLLERTAETVSLAGDSRDFFLGAINRLVRLLSCRDAFCTVFGPGVDTGQVGLTPNSVALWFVWADGKELNVGTDPPPGIEGFDTESLVVSRQAAKDFELVLAGRHFRWSQLPPRCEWIVAVESALDGATNARDELRSFKELPTYSQEWRAAGYEQFRLDFQELWRGVPKNPPDFRDDSYMRSLQRYFEQTNNALANLVFAWETLDESSEAQGFRLLDDARQARDDFLFSYGLDYINFELGCRYWLGI